MCLRSILHILCNFAQSDSKEFPHKEMHHTTVYSARQSLCENFNDFLTIVSYNSYPVLSMGVNKCYYTINPSGNTVCSENVWAQYSVHMSYVSSTKEVTNNSSFPKTLFHRLSISEVKNPVKKLKASIRE